MPGLKINDEQSIYYQSIEEGENLVLIHGSSTILALWYKIIATQLACHYPVMMNFLRGQGLCTMPAGGYVLPVPDMDNNLDKLPGHMGVDNTRIVERGAT